MLEYQSALDPTDTTRPTIRSVVANSVADEVVVTFSKPLFAGSAIPNDPRDATIATNLANYSISPALAITGVAVEGNVVTLTTAKPTPGVTAYTLTINNVRDVNNWPVAPNTTLTFSMGGAAASAQPKIYHWFTIAGKAAIPGSADGTNSAIRFNYLHGPAMNRERRVFVSDCMNGTIRLLVPEGTNWVSTTIAGKAGFSGSADGTNTAARFGIDWGIGWGVGQIARDSAGNVFAVDSVNHTIRKITPVGTNWVTTTIAGKARSPGSADGTNSTARFNYPNGVAVDADGNVIVADSANNTIRKLTLQGTDWVTTTIAGSAGHRGTADGTNGLARFNIGDGLEELAVDNGGNVFVTDYGNHTVRKITPLGTNWVTTTIAGKAGVAGGTDGANGLARFNGPSGVATDPAGDLYVADREGFTIRKLTPVGTNWMVQTIGGKAGLAGSANGTNSAARFYRPDGIAVDPAGNLYLGDSWNYTIRLGVPLPVFQSVTPINNGVALTLSAAPGQTVQLQYSSDLTSSGWTNLGNPITATSGTISATDTPGPAPRRFYRAIVVRP